MTLYVTPPHNSSRARQSGRQVRTAAAGDQLSFMVIEVGFSSRILTTHTDDSPPCSNVTWHCSFVIVHAQVYRRHRTPESGRDREISGDIDDCGKDTTVRVAPLWIDQPFVTPDGLYFDTVSFRFGHSEVEPLVERSPPDQLLKFLDAYPLFAHVISK